MNNCRMDMDPEDPHCHKILTIQQGKPGYLGILSVLSRELVVSSEFFECVLSFWRFLA